MSLFLLGDKLDSVLEAAEADAEQPAENNGYSLGIVDRGSELVLELEVIIQTLLWYAFAFVVRGYFGSGRFLMAFVVR